MIDIKSFFIDIGSALALNCGDSFDDADLARVADATISREIQTISAMPEHIEPLWIWLEKKPVKIYAKFFFESQKAGDFDKKSGISELSKRIKQVFKKGAFGAQIFIPHTSMEDFVSEILPIRDDLFFNKKLCIGINMGEIQSLDWSNLFAILSKLDADALVMNFAGADSAKFVGQIYGLMDSMPSGFAGELHFYLGNQTEKIEQVLRLAEKMHPKISDKLKFFMNA